MEFRIADTFTDSLGRLTAEEQKAAKTTAFDLQANPANPGHQFHRLDRAKDKRFWSVRVGSDLRIIVHRSDSDVLLCFVGRHDRAYEWAERRKLETHPRTGAAQFVEIRETVKEVVVPVYVTETRPRGAEADRAPAPVPSSAPALASVSEEDLLGYGVPPEWVADVRRADSASLLRLCDHLPAEAAEAVLELATGGRPRAPEIPKAGTTPFEHPDAQRRFRLMADSDDLRRALEFPWEKWTVFLHPEQRSGVERDYGGPARVSGSAGTGKTIVALHRAVHLAKKHPDSRVLLTTFSAPLAAALYVKLRRLLGDAPRVAERIDVAPLDEVAARLYRAHCAGAPDLATREEVRAALRKASADTKVSARFLLSEWEQVVDARSLTTWESYRDAVRLGRKTRLPEARRVEIWAIFERLRGALKAAGKRTPADAMVALAAQVSALRKSIYDFVVVDEAQDVGIPELKLLAALGGARPNGLFFTGDIGQRIFQPPFSWKAFGVDVRGRSRTLRVNYRTSHQIRSEADRLLDAVLTDADGVVEERKGTVSVFNGPPPVVRTFEKPEDEAVAVGRWIADRLAEDVLPHECAVFVRSEAEVSRARSAVAASGAAADVVDARVATSVGRVAVATMHLAKGLEFRCVAVMACDDEVVPSQSRIEAVGDDGDLEEVYATERHLLYVACTRAREQLIVTGVVPASEFLDDLGGRGR